MRLDDAAMLLRLQLRLGIGRHDAQVEPGRDFVDRHILGPAEDQLTDDLLRPGRTGFGVSADDDVIVAERKIVPGGQIHMVVEQFARLARPVDPVLPHHFLRISGRAQARFEAAPRNRPLQGNAARRRKVFQACQFVIPAKAGISGQEVSVGRDEIPAFAGMIS